MWKEIKKTANDELVLKEKLDNDMEVIWKLAASKDTKKKELLDAIRAARIYFGNVLHSTVITGYMEEYLYRGLGELYRLEGELRDL